MINHGNIMNSYFGPNSSYSYFEGAQTPFIAPCLNVVFLRR